MEQKYDLFPAYRGHLEYVCTKCGAAYPADQLLYACPHCGGVFLLEDKNFSELRKISGAEWRKIFDKRQMTHISALKGVFRFYELLAPIFDEPDIVYLGEANTPEVEANERLERLFKQRFSFKNDGQNPSASFKDRGMACAFSYLKWMCAKNDWPEVLAICASTGDTSAACAMYGAYVGSPIKTVVLLPQGKVTPQQLSQPLGSGALVLELPGVFDDCMKVVELLAEQYRVALLNSKNSWRILGQESYPCEIAQWHEWNVKDLAVFVPVGNAGNITAIMSGFLKLHELEIISSLPKIFGVQSEHADPVFRYYEAPPADRVWQPVNVRPSVAQAAMIGNPVSFPRVQKLVERYQQIAGPEFFQMIRVTEQEIIEAMLLANKNGHIACTQGGECLAGMKIARTNGLLNSSEEAVLDSTAHILKFADFQQKYFTNSFDSSYEISPNPSLANMPQNLMEREERDKMEFDEFINISAKKIADKLNMQKK